MRTVVITGASSGIGRSTAMLFSKKGWNVAATMRNLNDASAFNECKNISSFYLDTTNIQSVESCIAQIIQKYGTVDVLVNNAGVYETEPLELTSYEAIDKVVRTNINGVLYVTKAILPHFRKNKNGVLVNISSIAGRVTFPYQSAYHASKWAIEGASEGLRYELKPHNIKVKIIEPGMVKTSLYSSIITKPFESYPEDYATSFKKWHTYLINNFEKGYDPDLDASTIYKAATDNTNKLRYTTDCNTKLVFFLRRLLSLSIFQKMVSKQIK